MGEFRLRANFGSLPRMPNQWFGAISIWAGIVITIMIVGRLCRAAHKNEKENTGYLRAGSDRIEFLYQSD